MAMEVSDDEDDPQETWADDYMTDGEVEAWMAQQRTAEAHLSTRRTSQQLSFRNSMITHPLETLPTTTITTDGEKININPNTNVEFKDGDFMRVKYIVRNTTTREITLRGWIMRRTKVMDSILERKMNELCWVLHVDGDDARPYQIQGMEEASLRDVMRRRAIRLTNRLFPELSWRDENIHGDLDTILNKRVLVCRYKYVCTYTCAKARAANIWCERALLRLSQDECDLSSGFDSKLCAYDQSKLRHDWRGETRLGGDCQRPLHGEQRFLQREQKDHEAGRTESSASQLIHREYSLKKGNVGFVQSEELLNPSRNRDIDAIEIDIPSPKPEALEHNSADIQAALEIPLIDLTKDASLGRGTGLVSETRRLSIAVTSSSQTSVKTVKVTTKQSSTVVTQTQASNQSITGPSQKRSRPEAERNVCASKFPKTSYGNISRDRPRSGSSSSVEEILRSSTSTRKETDASSMTDGNASAQSILAEQRYTFGDCFCGAGGTSRGAVAAGLRVNWGFDFALPACQSYVKNFYRSIVYHISADRFISLKDVKGKVDILHLSPPCQFFSGAHTVAGKDDDMNVASLFAVSELLRKTKSRIVTLEQTSGLATRHPLFLNALIEMFTSKGFSIRWRIVNLKIYGLPQNRSRLIMIASW